MYAIAFDMKIEDLKKNYGEPYNAAYDEIRQEMDSLGFEWTQGSFYIAKEKDNSLGLKILFVILERLKLKIGLILQTL